MGCMALFYPRISIRVSFLKHSQGNTKLFFKNIQSINQQPFIFNIMTFLNTSDLKNISKINNQFPQTKKNASIDSKIKTGQYFVHSHCGPNAILRKYIENVKLSDCNHNWSIDAIEKWVQAATTGTDIISPGLTLIESSAKFIYFLAYFQQVLPMCKHQTFVWCINFTHLAAIGMEIDWTTSKQTSLEALFASSQGFSPVVPKTSSVSSMTNNTLSLHLPGDLHCLCWGPRSLLLVQ